MATLYLLFLTLLASTPHPLYLRTLDLKGRERTQFMSPGDIDLEVHVTPNADNRRVYIFCTGPEGDCGGSEFGLNGAAETPIFHRKFLTMPEGVYEIQVTVLRQEGEPLREHTQFQVN